MGRPRKNQNQKVAAKRANAANMQLLEKMEEDPLLSKKRGLQESGSESSVGSADEFHPGSSPERGKKNLSKKRATSAETTWVNPPLRPRPGPPSIKKDPKAKSSKPSAASAAAEREAPVSTAGTEPPPCRKETTLSNVGNKSSVSTTGTESPSSTAMVSRTSPIPLPAVSRAPTAFGKEAPLSDVGKKSQVSTPGTETPLSSAAVSTENFFAGYDKAGEPVQVEQYVNAVKELQQNVKQLQQKVEEQFEIIEKLQTENARLRRLNMNLQETLHARPQGLAFSDIPGYPDSEWLLKVSQAANDSDYIFVKDLLFRLFPGGVGNATVTGRKSNNPTGRKKKSEETVPEEQPAHGAGQLDPSKVTYIKDRLYERRRLLGDPRGVAEGMAKQTNKHIASAIANNPILRKVTVPQ